MQVPLLALLIVPTLVAVAALMPALVDIAPATAAPGDIADLVIGKQDSPDPVIPGTTLTYTISVDNLGPATATGVVVVDPLPSGITVSALPAGCSAAGQTVTCQFADIPVAPAPLPSVQFTVSVNPDATRNAYEHRKRQLRLRRIPIRMTTQSASAHEPESTTRTSP